MELDSEEKDKRKKRRRTEERRMREEKIFKEPISVLGSKKRVFKRLQSHAGRDPVAKWSFRLQSRCPHREAIEEAFNQRLHRERFNSTKEAPKSRTEMWWKRKIVRFERPERQNKRRRQAMQVA